jgi:large repetitive protein
MSVKRMGLAVVVLALGMSAPPTAGATDFTVDATSDTSDAAAGDGACKTSANKCTLRAASEEANALAAPDVIKFAAGVTNSATAPAT